MVSSRNRATIFAGFLISVLMIAAACGDSGDDQVAILTEDRPPPPATEPAGEMLPAEPSAPPAAPAEAPAEASEPPADPAPQPPPAAVEGDLDSGTAAAVVAALAESQRAATSARVQVYLSMQLSIDGVSAGSVSDVPFMLYTTSGDRTHVEIDQFALATLSAFEGGMPVAAPPANLPPIELIFDGSAQQMYIKGIELDPLAAGPGEIWGRRAHASLTDETLPIPVVGGRLAFADFLTFLTLLQAASDGGSILEARGDGLSEVAGVATQVYSFTIDLGALSGDLPPFITSFLAGPDAGGPPPEEFLGALPSLPAGLTVHVDTAGFVRQVQLDLDLGAILMAVFAGFGEMGDTPEGADIGLPEFEYLLSIRFETLAVNDPSLTVTLPDPSLVVDLP